MNYNHPNKENAHPNKIRISQDDISKISKQYVLDGERLKEKSRFQWDNMAVRKQEQIQVEVEEEQGRGDMDLQKLEYLEELGVLNQEEEKILERIRGKRKSPAIPQYPQYPQMYHLAPEPNSYGNFPSQNYGHSPYYSHNPLNQQPMNTQTAQNCQHLENYYNGSPNHYY